MWALLQFLVLQGFPPTLRRGHEYCMSFWWQLLQRPCFRLESLSLPIMVSAIPEGIYMEICISSAD
jgi:hypothetical protein